MNFKKVKKKCRMRNFLNCILVIIITLISCFTTSCSSENISRADYLVQLMQEVYEFDGSYQTQKNTPFEDVDNEAYVYPYIIKALEMGIIDVSDFDNMAFDGTVNISKDLAAAWTARTLGIYFPENYEFTDIDLITNVEEASSVCKLDVFEVKNNKFSPESSISKNKASQYLRKAKQIYDEHYKLRESPNTVTYNHDVLILDASEGFNVPIENANEYIKLKHPSSEILKLGIGDKFIVEPCELFPNGVAIKIYDKEYDNNNDILTVQRDYFEVGEFIENVDICMEIEIQKSNIIPAEGVTITEINTTSNIEENAQLSSSNIDNITTTNVDNKGSSPKVMLLASNKENLFDGNADSFKFGLDFKLNSSIKVSGDIIIGSPKLIFDVELKKKKVNIGLNYSCTADVNVEASTGNYADDYFDDFTNSLSSSGKYKIGTAEVAVGTTGMIANVEIYAVVDAYGNVGINYSVKNEAGVKYDGNKKDKINFYNKEDKDFSLDARSNFGCKQGILLTTSISWLELVHATLPITIGFSEELELDNSITNTISTDNHLCDLCLSGNVDFGVNINPNISVGLKEEIHVFTKKIGNITLVDWPINFNINMGDCYISRPKLSDNAKFGWGECPNKKIKGDKTESKSSNIDKSELTKVKWKWIELGDPTPIIIYEFKPDGTYIDIDDLNRSQKGKYELIDNKLKITSETHSVTYIYDETIEGFVYETNNDGKWALVRMSDGENDTNSIKQLLINNQWKSNANHPIQYQIYDFFEDGTYLVSDGKSFERKGTYELDDLVLNLNLDGFYDTLNYSEESNQWISQIYDTNLNGQEDYNEKFTLSISSSNEYYESNGKADYVILAEKAMKRELGDGEFVSSNDWEVQAENEKYIVYTCNIFIPNSARGGGTVSVSINKLDETAEVIDMFGRFDEDYVKFMTENGFIE